jgi:hypothetical protein
VRSVALVATLGFIVAACSPASSQTPSGVAPATESPAAAKPLPAANVNLAAQLDCDGAPQRVGGEIGAIPPVGGTGTASPYSWIYSLSDVDLPLEGFDEAPKVPWENGRAGLVRFEYRARARVKAIIVMAGHSVDGGQGAWSVVAYRACGGDEFDPKDGRTIDNIPWVGPGGEPGGENVYSLPGPAHCDWQSTTWLFFHRALYLRDPLGLFAGQTAGPFVANATLPVDARPTGYRSGDRELFVGASNLFVWVQTSHGLERWANASNELGCA